MLNMGKWSKFEYIMHIQLLCMLIIDIHQYIQPTPTKFSSVLRRTNTYINLQIVKGQGWFLWLLLKSEKDLTPTYRPTYLGDILHHLSVGMKSLPLLRGRNNIPPLFYEVGN
jgi:hypothetical protein